MLSVALFFYSCEDENSIIGYPNPNKKFQVYTIDIPLESSVILLDSVITDNKLVQSYISLVGAYTDPLLGRVQAISNLQFIPAFSTKLASDAQFDSAALQLRLNYYTYGLTADHYEKFNIHLIAGDTLNRLPSHAYYYNNTVTYTNDIFGSASVYLKYDTIKRQYTLAPAQQDTLLIRGRLTQELGEVLLNEGKARDYTDDEARKKFLISFKGLSLVPEGSSTIMGLELGANPSANFSRIYLYYHTATDTLTATFVVNPASFTNIQVDRGASELAGLNPYQETDPASGMRFVENGSPVATKLDLSNFYAFVDTTENILINEAQLVINNVQSPIGYAPHSSLRFRFLKDNNYFANSRVSGDIDAYKNYHFISDGSYFSVQADNPSQTNQFSVVSYDTDENRFNGYMTLFAQSVNDNKNDDDGINEKRLKYIAVYPNSPFISRTVNRTVFHKDDIKLRITYTRPTQSNLE
jgi:hypothetical protein